MRQFQVPQFIDVEDKIIGPLTLKQFLYLAGGGAIIVVAKALFLPALFYLVSFFVLAISLALAFYKLDGIPFPKVLASSFSYFSKPHLYIWKQEERAVKKESPAGAMELSGNEQLQLPKTSESKLEDLAWSLDIKEKLQR